MSLCTAPSYLKHILCKLCGALTNAFCSEQGLQDANQLSSQPDKVGWIRKFCGRGIFREIWKNRFVMLKGDHLYIFEKEVSFFREHHSQTSAKLRVVGLLSLGVH